MINFNVPKKNLRNINLFYSSLTTAQLSSNSLINCTITTADKYNIDPSVDSFFLIQ